MKGVVAVFFAAILLSTTISTVHAVGIVYTDYVTVVKSDTIYIDSLRSTDILTHTIDVGILTVSDPAGATAVAQNVSISSSQNDVEILSRLGSAFGLSANSTTVDVVQKSNFKAQVFNMIANQVLNVTSTNNIEFQASTTAIFRGNTVLAQGHFNVFLESNRSNVLVDTSTDLGMEADQFTISSTGLDVEDGVYINLFSGFITYTAARNVFINTFAGDFWGHDAVQLVADNSTNIATLDLIVAKSGTATVSSLQRNTTAYSSDKHIEFRAATNLLVEAQKDVVLNSRNSIFISAVNDGILHQGSHVHFGALGSVRVISETETLVLADNGPISFNAGTGGILFRSPSQSVSTTGDFIIGSSATEGFVDFFTSRDVSFGGNFAAKWYANDGLSIQAFSTVNTKAQNNIHFEASNLQSTSNILNLVSKNALSFESYSEVLQSSISSQGISFDTSAASFLSDQLYITPTTSAQFLAREIELQTGIYQFINSQSQNTKVTGRFGGIFGANTQITTAGDLQLVTTSNSVNATGVTVGCADHCAKSAIVGLSGVTANLANGLNSKTYGDLLVDAVKGNIVVQSGGSFIASAGNELAVLGGNILLQTVADLSLISADDVRLRTEGEFSHTSQLELNVFSQLRTTVNADNAFRVYTKVLNVTGGNQLFETDLQGGGTTFQVKNAASITELNSDIVFRSGANINTVGKRITGKSTLDLSSIAVQSQDLSASNNFNLNAVAGPFNVLSDGEAYIRAGTDLSLAVNGNLRIGSAGLTFGNYLNDASFQAVVGPLTVNGGGDLLGSGIGRDATFSYGNMSVTATKQGGNINIDGFDLLFAANGRIHSQSNRFYLQTNKGDDLTFSAGSDFYSYAKGEQTWKGVDINIVAPTGLYYSGNTNASLNFQHNFEISSSAIVQIAAGDKVNLISEKDMEFFTSSGIAIASETVRFFITNGGEWITNGNITLFPRVPPAGSNINVTSGGAISITASAAVLIDSSNNFLADIGGWFQARSDQASVLFQTIQHNANIDVKSHGRIDYEGAAGLIVEVFNETGGADLVTGVADIFFDADGSYSGRIGFTSDAGALVYHSNGVIQRNGVPVPDNVAPNQSILFHSFDANQGDQWFESTRQRMFFDIDQRAVFDAPSGPIAVLSHLQQEHTAGTTMSMTATLGRIELKAERQALFTSGNNNPIKAPIPGDILIHSVNKTTGIASQYIGFHTKLTNYGDGIHVESQHGDILFATGNGKDLHTEAQSDVFFITKTGDFKTISGNNYDIYSGSGALSIVAKNAVTFQTDNGPILVDAHTGAPPATGAAISLQAHDRIDVVSGYSLEMYAGQDITWSAVGVNVYSFDGRVDITTEETDSTVTFLSGSSIFVTSFGARDEPSDGIFMYAAESITQNTQHEFSINAINLVQIGDNTRPQVNFHGVSNGQEAISLNANSDVRLKSQGTLQIQAAGRADFLASELWYIETGGTFQIISKGTAGTTFQAQQGEIKFNAREMEVDAKQQSITMVSDGDALFRTLGEGIDDVFKITSAYDIDIQVADDFIGQIERVDIDAASSASILIQDSLLVTAVPGSDGRAVVNSVDYIDLYSGGRQRYYTTDQYGTMILETQGKSSVVSIQTLSPTSDIQFQGENVVLFEGDVVTMSTLDRIRFEANDLRNEGDALRGDLAILASGNIALSAVGDNFRWVGQKAVVIEATGSYDGIPPKGVVGAPLSIVSFAEVEFESIGDAIWNIGGNLRFTSAGDLDVNTNFGGDVIYSSDNILKFSSGLNMDLTVGRNQLGSVQNILSYTATSASPRAPNYGILVNVEGTKTAKNPNLELDAIGGSVYVHGQTGVGVTAGNLKGGSGVSADINMYVEKTALLSGQKGNTKTSGTTAVYLKAESSDINLSATHSQFQLTSSTGTLFETFQTTTPGVGLTITANGLEDNAEYAVRFGASNTNVIVDANGPNANLIGLAHDGIFLTASGAKGVANIVSFGYQIANSNGIEIVSDGSGGADVVFHSTVLSRLGGQRVDMLAASTGSSDPSDSIFKVFATNTIYVSAAQNLEVDAKSLESRIAFLTTTDAVHANIVSKSSNYLNIQSGAGNVIAYANGPFDSNMSFLSRSSPLQIQAPEADFLTYGGDIQVNTPQNTFFSSSAAINVNALTGSVNFRSELPANIVPVMGVSVYARNAFQSNSNGRTTFTTNKNTRIQASSIYFGSIRNTQHDTNENIFIDSQGDVTFSATTDLIVSAGFIDGNFQDGNGGWGHLNIEAVAGIVAGKGVIFAPQADTVFRFTEISQTAKFLIPSTEENNAGVGSGAPCANEREMILAQGGGNPRICICDSYQFNTFKVGTNPRQWKCVNMPSNN